MWMASADSPKSQPQPRATTAVAAHSFRCSRRNPLRRRPKRRLRSARRQCPAPSRFRARAPQPHITICVARAARSAGMSPDWRGRTRSRMLSACPGVAAPGLSSWRGRPAPRAATPPIPQSRPEGQARCGSRRWSVFASTGRFPARPWNGPGCTSHTRRETACRHLQRRTRPGRRSGAFGRTPCTRPCAGVGGFARRLGPGRSTGGACLSRTRTPDPHQHSEI